MLQRSTMQVSNRLVRRTHSSTRSFIWQVSGLTGYFVYIHRAVYCDEGVTFLYNNCKLLMITLFAPRGTVNIILPLSLSSMDYMHLVWLGVLNRLLALWLHGPVANRRHLRQSHVGTLGGHILSCSDSMVVSACWWRGPFRSHGSSHDFIVCFSCMFKRIAHWWIAWALHVNDCVHLYFASPSCAQNVQYFCGISLLVLCANVCFAAWLQRYDLFCKCSNSFSRVSYVMVLWTAFLDYLISPWCDF